MLFKLWFSYFRIIFSIVFNIYFSILLFPYSLFFNCHRYDATNAFDLLLVCDENTPNFIAALANMPQNIMQPFVDVLPGVLSIFYLFIFLFFLFLNSFGLLTFMIIGVVDMLVIRNYDIEKKPKIIALLFSEIILIFLGLVTFLSWFIPEIPSIIDSLFFN